MGKFWFSKVPARLKRLCILGYVAELRLNWVDELLDHGQRVLED